MLYYVGKKAWPFGEDNRDDCRIHYGKEKPIHNIQPSGEHSPGANCVIVNVYNQEQTSQDKYTLFTTRCKAFISLKNKKTRLDFDKSLSGKALFGQIKLRSTCTRMKRRKRYSMEKAWNSS